MYSVAQMSVGVGGVGARRAPHCSSRNTTTCGAKSKEKMLDFRFRVSLPLSSNPLQVESITDRKKLQPHYRIWDSFGLICKSSTYDKQVLSTRSGRSFSVSPRAQVSGEVAETVREVSQEELSLNSGFVEDDEVEGDGVALRYGWKVREASRFDVEELRAVAQVQTSSFHIGAAVFDDLFFKLFKAEVLSTLIYKAKHSPSDRYACLLAEPAVSMDEGESGDDESAPMIVGAVNVAASVDNEVLRHPHNADEYLYVSGMAVDTNYRWALVRQCIEDILSAL